MDIRTLLLVLAVASACSALILGLALRMRFTVPGLLHWALGGLVTAAAMLGIALRGVLPDLITIVAANSAVVLAFGLFHQGIRQFNYLPPMRWATWAGAVALAPVTFWFSEVHPNLTVRVAAGSALISIYCLVIVVLLIRGSRKRASLAQNFAAGFFALHGLMCLARTVLAAHQIKELSLLASNPFTAAFFLWSVAFAMGATTGMLMMIGQALQEEVTLLKDILPICSYCKRVRDPENQWHDVDAYMTRQAKVDFSHGICPDCLEKHFPDCV